MLNILQLSEWHPLQWHWWILCDWRGQVHARFPWLFWTNQILSFGHRKGVSKCLNFLKNNCSLWEMKMYRNVLYRPYCTTVLRGICSCCYSIMTVKYITGDQLPFPCQDIRGPGKDSQRVWCYQRSHCSPSSGCDTQPGSLYDRWVLYCVDSCLVICVSGVPTPNGSVSWRKTLALWIWRWGSFMPHYFGETRSDWVRFFRFVSLSLHQFMEKVWTEYM